MSTRELILSGLNPEQQRVVEHDTGPMLVASVAGSGKTTAIVRRMAYLSTVREVKPEYIFGVTFSKKTAQEMSDRVTKLVPSGAIHIQTFHAFCRRVLSQESQGFSSLTLDDEGYRYRILVKRTFDKEHLAWPAGDPEECCSFIEMAKAYGYPPESEEAFKLAEKRYEARRRPTRMPTMMARVYEIAEQLRKEAFLVTFSDWMVEVRDLFRDNEDVRARWASKFKYIMVDEAQDNNPVQASIIESLGKDHKNVMLIGDSGQSIYSFRGAAPELFVNFPSLWNAPVVSMNRNYRSCKKIITAANAILDTMDPASRCGELISPERPADGEVLVQGYETQEVEADHVAQDIIAMHSDAEPWKSSVVLYRTNSLSRAIEEAFIKHKVPYHIVGATFFYARKEISTLISYLKVAWRKGATMEDVKRSLFMPQRFLGKVFLANVEEASREKPESFYALVQRAIELNGRLNPGQRGSAANWGLLIDELRADVAAGEERGNPGEMIQKIVAQTKYKEWIKREEGRDAPDNDRVSNIAELVRAATMFADVGGFLEHVKLQLEAFEASKKESFEDRVTMMSCHRSKGLEWNNVFLVTCNERVLPHVYAEDKNEERRIFYVAITRAKDKLKISYVKGAVSGGEVRPLDPSQFLDVIETGQPEERERIEPPCQEVKAIEPPSHPVKEIEAHSQPEQVLRLEPMPMLPKAEMQKFLATMLHTHQGWTGEICTDCSGTGEINNDGDVCPWCGGTGDGYGNIYSAELCMDPECPLKMFVNGK